MIYGQIMAYGIHGVLLNHLWLGFGVKTFCIIFENVCVCAWCEDRCEVDYM